MSNRTKNFWFRFLLVCLGGVFVFFAGGISWGTEQAGCLSFFILFLAGVVAGLSTLSREN